MDKSSVLLIKELSNTINCVNESYAYFCAKYLWILVFIIAFFHHHSQLLLYQFPFFCLTRISALFALLSRFVDNDDSIILISYNVSIQDLLFQCFPYYLALFSLWLTIFSNLSICVSYCCKKSLLNTICVRQQIHAFHSNNWIYQR